MKISLLIKYLSTLMKTGETLQTTLIALRRKFKEILEHMPEISGVQGTCSRLSFTPRTIGGGGGCLGSSSC